MDRTIIATLEQMRSFDYVQGNHDILLGVGNLAQDILSQMGLLATSQIVVAGAAATQSGPPSLTVNIGPGRIYALSAADATTVSAITADTTIVCQQGSGGAQSVTLVPPSAGQSQWNLIQCQYQQGDAVRTNDPTGGVVPFYNSSNPSVPTPTTINTVRQARLVVQVLTGASVATGSEVPPQPSSNWTPLYLVDLVGGQTQVTNAQIFVAGPSVGTGVPSNYPRAPFLAGLLASHHSGNAGQAPKVNLAAEVSGVLPYANMSPVRTLLGSALTLYVNAATGSDSNSGTDPSHPFLTVQAALNAIYRNYDFNGNNCTISVANGAYNASGASGLASMVGVPVGLNSRINIVGNIASPGSVTWTQTNGNCVSASGGALVALSGMTITASGTNTGLVTAAGYGISAGGGASIVVSNIVVGACGEAQLDGNTGGVITAIGPVTLTGTCQAALAAEFNGVVWVNAQVLTVSGLSTVLAFALTDNSGAIQAQGVTFVGSATGPRYNAIINGTIVTGGGGANYFPGNSAGSTSSGGQYV